MSYPKDKYEVAQNYASWKDLLEFDVLVYPIILFLLDYEVRRRKPRH